MRFSSALLITSLALSANSWADSFDSTKSKIEAAMKADIRVEADTKRDRNRLPVHTLEFMGLRDDMKVVELLPGGGWYTKILAPVLSENGELHLAYGTSRAAKLIEANNSMSEVKLAAKDAEIFRKEGARFYSMKNNPA